MVVVAPEALAATATNVERDLVIGRMALPLDSCVGVVVVVVVAVEFAVGVVVGVPRCCMVHHDLCLYHLDCALPFCVV